MQTLDINLLRTLVAFADSGSCAGAADLVHKTQAAVSLHLKRLEATVDRRLFEKRGRNLHLTPAGHDLVGYGRRILQLHGEALARFDREAVTGTLRVGLPDDYIPVLLSGLLSEFAATYPKAQFDLVCAPSAELRPLLAEGKLDVAVLSAETDTKEGAVLKTEPAVWVAGHGYRDDGETPVPLILFPEGCILRKWALNALAAQGRDHRVVCTSRNMLALQTAASRGFGVMIVTRSNIPEGCAVLTPEQGFPTLPEVTILLALGRATENSLSRSLARHLREQL